MTYAKRSRDVKWEDYDGRRFDVWYKRGIQGVRAQCGDLVRDCRVHCMRTCRGMYGLCRS